MAFVRDPEVVGKLFSELSERYRQRAGGYTRIIKMGYRTGDNAPLSSIEFIDTVQKKKPKKKAPAAS
jgi:large subunit ribosomal protein L17